MLSAETLGIEPWERTALLRVRGLLSALDTAQFDMGQAAISSECGTVACIGGWVYLLTHSSGNREYSRAERHKASQYVSRYHHSRAQTSPLTGLYYPTELGLDEWDRITPEMAIQAIKNFLETGEPRWRDVWDSGLERRPVGWAEQFEED